MKSCFFLLSALTLLNATAQRQVTINGSISGLKEGTKVYVVPNSQETWRDSTVVQHGNFHFKLHIPEATSYNIRLSREYKGSNWKDFYLDEGVLNIKGTNGDFSNVGTSGSQYALDYNSYLSLLASKKVTATLIAIEKQSEKASQNNDTIQGAKLYQEYERLDALKTTLAMQWVLRHPESAVSAFILYQDVRDRTSIEKMEHALNSLSETAKANRFGKQLQAIVDATKVTATGKTAPDFTQNDTLDKPVSLHDFRGKFVLIDFWASWCVPCRAENPHLIKTFKKFKDKNFTILSVSLDSDKGKWLQAIRNDHLLWTQVSDLKFWDNKVATQYGIHAVPSNLLLDTEGKIIAKDLRGDELEKALAENIR